MKNTKELIGWFWSEYNLSGSRVSGWKDGFCQCVADSFIEKSSDPKKSRAFLIIAVLIDQMMYTHFYDLYASFRSQFKYPKLYAHAGYGMASPNWFAYSYHRFDKKMDWSLTRDIAVILFKSLYAWFKKTGNEEKIHNFNQLLDMEINFEFELKNKGKLITILKTLK